MHLYIYTFIFIYVKYLCYIYICLYLESFVWCYDWFLKISYIISRWIWIKNIYHIFIVKYPFLYISIGVYQGRLSMCQDLLLYQKRGGNMPIEAQVVLSLWLAFCCGAWTCRRVLLCIALKVWLLFLFGGSCHCLYLPYFSCFENTLVSEQLSKP